MSKVYIACVEVAQQSAAFGQVATLHAHIPGTNLMTFMLCEVQCWSTQYHPTASGEISAPRRHVLGTNTRPMDHVRCKAVWYLAAWFKHATDTPQMRATRHTSCVNCKVRMLHAAVSNLEPHHSPTTAPSRPHNSPITAQSQSHHSLITAPDM